MRIAFITVGKTSDKRIAALTQEYADRISHYAPLELLFVPDIKASKSMPAEVQKLREAEGIKKLLRDGDYIVLLDERGR